MSTEAAKQGTTEVGGCFLFSAAYFWDFGQISSFCLIQMWHRFAIVAVSTPDADLRRLNLKQARILLKEFGVSQSEVW